MADEPELSDGVSDPLDPELAALVDAYVEETARDPGQVDTALQRVGDAVAGGPGPGSGPGGGEGTLSFGAKAGIAVALVGVVAAGAVALDRSEPGDPVEVHDASPPSTEDVLAGGPQPDPARGEPDPDAPAEASAADGAGLAAAPSLPAASASAPTEDGARAGEGVAQGPAGAEDELALAERSEHGADDRTEDAPKPRPRAAAAPPAGLDEDLALMQAARTALRSGNPRRALELLGQHRRDFGASAFAPERDASEIAALCAAGRDAEARGRAADFERAHPDSERDLLAGCE